MAKQVLTDLDFNSVARPINLPTPTAGHHPATKDYVDSAVEGLAWKDSCRVSTQANINLASPGATIDGVTMAVNDRVLVRGQTLPQQNGIYVWNGAATPMTRALDANTSAELEQAVTTVEGGTDGGATFRQTTIDFTIDSGNVVWTSFGTSAPAATETAAGIAELATQGEVDAGTDTQRIVTPATLAGYAGRVRRYITDIGDGSNTSFTVTHNLNSRDVVVQVRRNSGAYDYVIVDAEATTLNSVTIRFSAAPASNAFRAVVMA